ncbi:phage recombination protein Bet [Psychrobacillus sp. FJAT-21963]|uniref:phage recombination protein Bet n=1 Tax=Psychrobacillus sp. FJAT-21963 TaxID=1712028 RepID=UPI0006FF5A9A|nr:phage recombination protein Bet [Psychrobacillus sp. FJAT-21963]KQL37157.1 recombination protein Bet [Psychrobacillus sp. FJAT-21963]
MTNATQNEVMTHPIKFEVNGEEVKLSGNTIKQYLVRGNGNVSDQETVMFMNLCKFQKLNPFLNEAYLIKFGSSPAQIIVSKEAFMKRAEGHEMYEGFEAGIIVEREGQLLEIEGAVKLEKDKLIGGWCKVYRSDRKVPIVTKIDFKEFGKNQATWKEMPMNMIRKSAVVNGLREAFPESLGAMHTEEEVSNKPAEERVIEKEIEQNANQEIIDIQAEEVLPEEGYEQEIIIPDKEQGPGF